MRPIRVTLSSATSSNPIILDTYRNPFNIGIGVTFSTGAVLTYTVEYTYDDVFSGTYDPNAASSVWFPVLALSAKSASFDGTITSPVMAVRFRVSSFTSGSATMTVIQAGMPGA
jgi:hypothetical protein